MVNIGKLCGRNIAALITNMDTPLGYAIGNSLEVCEAIEVLRGGGPEDLRTVCIELATAMVRLALDLGESEARERVLDSLSSGAALATLRTWIDSQGGDSGYIDDTAKFPPSRIMHEVRATRSGYVTSVNAETIGIASVELGAGRARKDENIDHAAGIMLYAKPGVKVSEGDLIAVLHTDRESAVSNVEKAVICAVSIEDNAPAPQPLIYGIIG